MFPRIREVRFVIIETGDMREGSDELDKCMVCTGFFMLDVRLTPDKTCCVVYRKENGGVLYIFCRSPAGVVVGGKSASKQNSRILQISHRTRA